MTAPTTCAVPKIALDQRAQSRHDNARRMNRQGVIRPGAKTISSTGLAASVGHNTQAATFMLFSTSVKPPPLSGPASPSDTSTTREILDFYRLGPEALWFTFFDGHLWWAHAEPEVVWLGESASSDDMALGFGAPSGRGETSISRAGRC